MDTQTIASSEPLRPLRREEYDRLVDAGVFDGERLELLWGLIVTMSPQGAPHAWVIQVLTQPFVERLGSQANLRVQLPLAVSEYSEPEPDLALVVRSDEWRKRHPETALLVVEVSGSSLRVDRKKTRLYAAAGCPETWVVDVEAGHVEVYTDPAGGQYRTMPLYPNDLLTPVAFPDAAIRVDAILP